MEEVRFVRRSLNVVGLVERVPPNALGTRFAAATVHA